MVKHHIKAQLSSLAEGALQERFNYELAKVAANCMDVNTDSKKKRKITINISVTTDDLRQDIYLDFETKSTLAPRENVGTRVLIDQSGDEIYANELLTNQRGQMFFDPKDATLKDDKGTPVEEIESIQSEETKQNDTSKIHSFKKQANS
ncbi:hypothetical protein IGK74_001127 [Enterococcus sp. AZ150]|uniref:hypothetical protein n=1 Tax=Enterococcus sp. AZ150 TaxID=2774866 RepID=UPI003F22C586